MNPVRKRNNNEVYYPEDIKKMTIDIEMDLDSESDCEEIGVYADPFGKTLQKSGHVKILSEMLIDMASIPYYAAPIAKAATYGATTIAIVTCETKTCRDLGIMMTLTSISWYNLYTIHHLVLNTYKKIGVEIPDGTFSSAITAITLIGYRTSSSRINTHSSKLGVDAI